MADGATVIMADTPENQKEYPQISGQKPGCGFPIMRVLVLFALSTGVVLETALGKYQGKLTHEVSLFRTIDQIIKKGDVFLADRAFAGWFEMARMEQRGAHYVVRMHQMRKADFRKGIHYGKDDHAIRIDKPACPAWMSPQEHGSYPDFIVVREIRICVTQKGFRSKEIIVHTSLEDDLEYSKEEIGLLFRRRWQAELNLRSIKTVMQPTSCRQPTRSIRTTSQEKKTEKLQADEQTKKPISPRRTLSKKHFKCHSSQAPLFLLQKPVSTGTGLTHLFDS